MFAPEIVLLAGGVIAVAGASTRVRVWLVTLALACAAVVGVGVSAATHPSLLEHAPPDIIFGGWR